MRQRGADRPSDDLGAVEEVDATGSAHVRVGRGLTDRHRRLDARHRARSQSCRRRFPAASTPAPVAAPRWNLGGFKCDPSAGPRRGGGPAAVPGRPTSHSTVMRAPHRLRPWYNVTDANRAGLAICTPTDPRRVLARTARRSAFRDDIRTVPGQAGGLHPLGANCGDFQVPGTHTTAQLVTPRRRSWVRTSRSLERRPHQQRESGWPPGDLGEGRIY